MANKEFQVRHGLAVNNNVLVANTVTGNVSIGSNTASYKLDVAGTVRANRLRTWNSASNADWDAFEILSSGASSILKSYGDETGLILRSEAGNIILADDRGNVGIGTSAPANKLDVRGTLGVGQSSNSALNIFTVTSSIVGADNHRTIFAGPSQGTNDEVIFNLSRGGGAYGSFDVKFGGVSRFFIPGENLTGDASINLPTNSNFIFKNNNTERMRFDANGNLGIGTTTPLSKLSVYGTGSSGMGLFISYGHPAGWGLSGAGEGGLGFITSTSNTFRFHTSGYNYPLTLDGSTVILQGSGATGNVGIGTASPSAKLHVAGDAIFTGNVTISGNTSYVNTQTLLIGDNLITLNADISSNTPGTEDAGIEVNRGSLGNASFIWDETNDKWDIRANNNNLISVLSTGSVGIGTTTPSASLHIAGFQTIVQSAAAAYSLWKDATPTKAWQYILTGNDSAFRHYDGSSWIERVRIDTNGNLLVGANTGSARIYSKVNDSTYSFAAVGVSKAIRITHTGTLSSIDGVDTTLSGSYQPLRLVGSTLTFSISGDSAVEIDSGRNVGIGTGANTLYSKFTISGGNQDQWEFNSNNATYNGGILEYINRSGFNNRPDMTLYVGAANSNMKFATGGSERMRIDSTGNVAIGQTSAPERLTVFRDTDNSAEIGRAHIGYIGFNDYAGFSHVDQNITTNYALLQQSTGQTYLNSASGAPIYFRHGNSDQMTLSAGNLGIGTTSPTGRLDVWTVGSGRAIQTNPNDLGYAFTTFNASAGNAEQFNIKHNLAAVELRNERGQLNIVTNTANPIVFYTANTAERMRINTNGNVGIGNTAPDALLHVAGTTILGGDTVGVMDVKFSRSLGGTRAINHWFTHSSNSPWYLFGQNMTWNGERTGTVDPTHAYRPYYEAYAPVVGYKEFGFANVSSGSIASSNLIANMVLTNTGNIGMGTLAPTEKLHVVGNILLPQSTANTGAILGVGSSDNFTTSGVIMPHYGLKWASPNDSVGPTGFLSAFYGFRFFVAGAEAMRIDANTRNVGINSTSPGTKLEIKGIDSAISFDISGSGASALPCIGFNRNVLTGGIYNSSVSGWQFSARDSYFALEGYNGVNTFATASGSIFAITKANAFVGIGTTTPSQRLTVAGGQILVGPTDNGNSYINFYSTTYRVGASNGLEIQTGSGDVIRFLRGATESARIDSSGNMGIGTTSPASIFNVNAGASGGGAIFSSQGFNYATVSQIISSADAVFGGGVIASNVAAELIKTVANDVHYFKAQITDGLTFHTGITGAAGTAVPRTTNERMRITSTGNVGIGVTSVTAKFVSSGTARIGTLTTDYAGDVQLSADYVRIWNPGNAPAGQIRFGINQETTIRGQALVGLMFDTDGSERMRIANTGNIGIGTSSPSYRLDVSAAVANGVRFDGARPITFNSNGLGEIRIKASSGGWATGYLFSGSAGTDLGGFGAYGGSDSLTYHWIGTAYNTPTAVFTSGGNVGIGTINPGYILDVQANTGSNHYIQVKNYGSLGGRAGIVLDSSGGSDADVVFRNQGISTATIASFPYAQVAPLVFYTNNSTTMVEVARFNNSGFLGIGTPSPQYRLDIGGTIRANGYTIGVDSGPNIKYVFTNDGGASYINSGNFGIGTTSPTARLQVTGASSTTAFLALGQGGANYFVDFNGTGANYSDATTHYFRGNAGNGTWMTLTGSNVGIGTTSPQTKLDVRGVIQGSSYTIPDTSGSYQWVKLGTLTTAQQGYTAHIRAYIHAGYNALNSQDFYVDIFFKTSNGASVDSNGFAGNSWYYGTGFQLHPIGPKWVGNAAGVSATSYDLYLYLPSFTLRSHYKVEIPDGATWVHTGTIGQTDPGSSSNTVCVSSAGYNILYGNVGIGTTTATAALTVATGDIMTTVDAAAKIGWNRSGKYFNWIECDGVGGNNYMRFATGNAEAMRITSAQNVGIGTSSPSSKLHVTSSTSAYSDTGMFEIGDSSRNGLSMGYDGTNNWSWIYSRSVGVQSRPISFNNSTLHIGQAGGAVGINTSAPSGTFQTAGSGDQNIYFSHTDNAAGRTVTLRLGSSNQTYLNRSTYIQAIEGSGIDNYSLAFGTTLGTDASAQERMRITREGNIGVGTTSPGDFGVIRNFEIANTSGSQVRVRGTNVDMHMQANDVASVGILGNRSNHALMLKTNDAERMRIDSSGQVGIGTTSPLSKLHVYGSQFTSIRVETNSTQASLALYDGDTSSSSTRNWAITSNKHDFGDMAITTSNTRGGDPIGAGTTRLCISNAGNIGIGTTAPQTKLEVSDSNANGGGIRVSNPSVTNQYLSLFMMGPSGFGVTGWANSAVIEAVASSAASGDRALYLSAFNGPVILSTNGRNERMRIDANGNVGIGTNNPNSKLHVSAGNITIDNAYGLNFKDGLGTAESVISVTTANNVSFATPSSGGAMQFNLRNNSGRYGFYNSSATELFTILSGGNVGIGTSAPQTRLHVGTKITDDAGYTYDSNTFMVIHQAPTGTSRLNDPKTVMMLSRQGWGGEAFGAAAAFNLSRYENAGTSNVGSRTRLDITLANDAFIAQNTTVMTLLSGGNVGIGTTAPSAKLQISNAGSFTAIRATNTTDSVQFDAIAGSTAVAIGAATSHPLVLNTGNTERMRITSDGNVAIGQASTTYKLQVNGSFAANTKSFVIDHPTKPGMKLRHGSLEGPENGVYVRGKTKEKVIELPEYWRGLIDSSTITVQLTAIGRSQNLYVVDVSNNRVYIDSENYTDVDCYYYIQAERKDVEKLVVEY